VAEPFRCIGFADRAFTVPCPEPVTCEVHVKHDGRWGGWQKLCGRHADGTVEVLGSAPGYEVERRALCADCPDVLTNGMRDLGAEVTVSTAAPAVAGPYATEPFTCPHGVTYWMEPTGEHSPHGPGTRCSDHCRACRGRHAPPPGPRRPFPGRSRRGQYGCGGGSADGGSRMARRSTPPPRVTPTSCSLSLTVTEANRG
jgi:hypothetical protein